ncbi:3,4-dihydroxy-2-butanone-4-phosphate synthase [Sneathiella chinensis]|uniref:3,4-dihydroxy-2-butanone 4-phosphate synthase n=1 Tax=Sneathiella chinensis TaxID=349750 RepID=A0ABQ5U4Z8_9PROT|nr:3,4-dihydroxy-2-butanone-4-phosphate synthase [Sneathiella chinensis]GLQ06471.1 3,4-dihydroxy-2-butanone-4-phosphate synthase [Sneathiella chinensis]
MSDSYKQYLSPIEDILDDARNGKMIILVDAEDRENEGDLVIPAQMATPDVINFMAKYGRGLICLTMTEERINELELPLMAQSNASRLHTNFTVSIEAREGVTTGISAADRAHTISVAIDHSKGAQDIVSPGHVFPLVAREGGVLRRTGHTEAAVDIARLAGLMPYGVICEIMNDDGTMARLPDLVEFAKTHGLKVGTIADLIAYRRRHDSLITREVETDISSKYGGDWKMIVFSNKPEYAEHVALVKGDITADEPALVRMHALNLLGDVLGESDEHPDMLHDAMEQINEAGKGVVVLIREPRPMALSDRVRKKLGKPVKENPDLRDYGIGAQILLDLGVREMVLLSNTERHIIGLEGYSLKIVETRPITAKG